MQKIDRVTYFVYDWYFKFLKLKLIHRLLDDEGNPKPRLWSILHDETKQNGNCNKREEHCEEEEHMVYDDDIIVRNNT